MSTVTITSVNNKISVRAPYNPEWNPGAKALGGRWNAGAKIDAALGLEAAPAAAPAVVAIPADLPTVAPTTTSDRRGIFALAWAIARRCALQTHTRAADWANSAVAMVTAQARRTMATGQLALALV